MYSKLDTKRKNDIYRFGKAKKRKSIDFTNVRFIKELVSIKRKRYKKKGEKNILKPY